MNTQTLASLDAELTAAGYDMTRTHVALVVGGIVYGAGRTEDEARADAVRWLAETDRTLDEYSEDEIVFVPITEYQASIDGEVAIDALVRRH